MKKYLLTAFWIIILFAAKSSAQENNANNPAAPEEKKEDRWGFGAHPMIGYDDKSSWTFGAGAVIYFEPEDKNQELDEIGVTASYNLEKQYDLMLEYSKYFKNNICSIDGTFGYQNYPDDYTGENYDAEYFPFEIGASFRVLKKFYIGPLYSYKYSDTEFENENINDENITGTGKIHLSGFGGQIIYKNLPAGQIYRREGNIFKITSVYYSGNFFSSAEFTALKADYRHYLPVLKNSVLAFQITGKATLGDVPFYEIPELEGKDILRGGSSMSGKYFLSGQTEFRFPIYWRIGATLFIGAGEVENQINNFGNDISIAGGAGIRIALNKRKSINLRFDIAFNEKGESSKYIKIKEAF